MSEQTCLYITLFKFSPLDLHSEAHCPHCGTRCGMHTADYDDIPGDKCSGQVEEIGITSGFNPDGILTSYPKHSCAAHAPEQREYCDRQ